MVWNSAAKFGFVSFIGLLAVTLCENDASAASPKIELIGTATISGTAVDATGETAALVDGSPANRMGGWSGMEWSGQGNRFFLLADRGAGDGLVDYQCRYHEVELECDEKTRQIQFRTISTQTIAGADGCPIVGSLTAHASDLVKHACTAMDPEGLRILANGDFLICEEYGPRLAVVGRDGLVRREFVTADTFRLLSDKPGEATHGAFPNRAWEGVAITPSGNRIVAALQGPLIQDAEVVNGWLTGQDCRFAAYDQTGKPTEQWIYRLDSSNVGLSEILAVDEERFLVIERDGGHGDDAKIKRVYLADVGEAADVSDTDDLITTKACERQAITKTLFLDFLDPRFSIRDEKPEGMCWGEPLEDGRRTLWVCWDNDFEPTRNSLIACFAISDVPSLGKVSLQSDVRTQSSKLDR
ncbi:esterase-like activity of phytase family protein [Rubripirellula amarantea]|nr:esterase-like activity of phytase family protein [Rubripirellula amarantea]